MGWKPGLAGMLMVLTLVGCDHISVSTKPPPKTADVRQAQELPRALAAPPGTINWPLHVQQPPEMRALEITGNVHMYSRARWRGRIVTFYYVPPQNVAYQRDHYVLTSGSGVQRLGSTIIRTDGTWEVLWRVAGQPLPKRSFILARTDAGETGLTQMQHVQQW